MANEIPKLYTEKEAAEILTIGHSTLQKARWAGKIRFIRINGRDVRYTLECLSEYLEKSKRNAEAKQHA